MRGARGASGSPMVAPAPRRRELHRSRFDCSRESQIGLIEQLQRCAHGCPLLLNLGEAQLEIKNFPAKFHGIDVWNDLRTHP